MAEAHALPRADRTRVSTAEIDAAIEELFARRGVIPLFKGFPGEVPFPAVTCISVNEEIVHGIPGHYRLQPGDIVKVDTGCKLNGWCGDAAWTYAVGEIDDEKRRLMAVGEANPERGDRGVRARARWSEVARRMMRATEEAGFSVVEQFVGHGIGREMHEPPQVPNYTNASTAARRTSRSVPAWCWPSSRWSTPGTRNQILADHWTAVTADGRPSVHFEHTVALTANGPELLTPGVGE